MTVIRATCATPTAAARYRLAVHLDRITKAPGVTDLDAVVWTLLANAPHIIHHLDHAHSDITPKPREAQFRAARSIHTGSAHDAVRPLPQHDRGRTHLTLTLRVGGQVEGAMLRLANSTPFSIRSCMMAPQPLCTDQPIPTPLPLSLDEAITAPLFPYEEPTHDRTIRWSAVVGLVEALLEDNSPMPSDAVLSLVAHIALAQHEHDHPPARASAFMKMGVRSLLYTYALRHRNVLEPSTFAPLDRFADLQAYAHPPSRAIGRALAGFARGLDQDEAKTITNTIATTRKGDVPYFAFQPLVLSAHRKMAIHTTLERARALLPNVRL